MDSAIHRALLQIVTCASLSRRSGGVRTGRPPLRSDLKHNPVPCSASDLCRPIQVSTPVKHQVGRGKAAVAPGELVDYTVLPSAMGPGGQLVNQATRNPFTVAITPGPNSPIEIAGLVEYRLG